MCVALYVRLRVFRYCVALFEYIRSITQYSCWEHIPKSMKMSVEVTMNAFVTSAVCFEHPINQQTTTIMISHHKCIDTHSLPSLGDAAVQQCSHKIQERVQNLKEIHLMPNECAVYVLVQQFETISCDPFYACCKQLQMIEALLRAYIFRNDIFPNTLWHMYSVEIKTQNTKESLRYFSEWWLLVWSR